MPEKILTDLKKQLENGDVELFNDFQLQVYQQLETDLFPLFVKRSFYKTYSGKLIWIQNCLNLKSF